MYHGISGLSNKAGRKDRPDFLWAFSFKITQLNVCQLPKANSRPKFSLRWSATHWSDSVKSGWRLSRTDYIPGLTPSSSKARAWRGVGVVGRSKRYFRLLGRLTLLRARVARSARRLRKLCTGIPSSVRREVALRRAAGERCAGGHDGLA